jgi:hypothetical protein
LALASSALPSSTKASSITGSSKKLASNPSDGTSRLVTPTKKLALLPKPTKLFMLGLPAARLLKPSMSKPRPGPKSAKDPKAALTGTLSINCSRQSRKAKMRARVRGFLKKCI